MTKKTLPFLALAILIAGGAGCANNDVKRAYTSDDAVEIQNSGNEMEETSQTEVDEDETVQNHERIFLADADPKTFNACEEEWDMSPPDTSTVYVNRDYGFSLTVPYNIKWGSLNYKLYPYRDNVDQDGLLHLAFGPASSGGACGVEYAYSLYAIRKMDLDEALTSINGWNTVEEPEIQTTSNGFNVIYYKLGDLCGGWNVEIIGNNFNYLIGGCYLEKETVSDLISSFELL